ncbi:MAG: sugar phosphate isomerase/epimerase [Isosphaeraceae bacterium]|nr:sugar phosphate isomerase/epimerase [Isosphaeraceae bacterium]
MIRSPLGLRLPPNPSLRDQILEAAKLGAKGVVLDAIGDIAPERLSDSGRRDLRHLLRSTELSLIALSLPTRRPFDSVDQLDDRLRRADNAFALAYDLGTRLVLVRVGPLPPESDAPRRETFVANVAELGRRADHRGVRLAIETGTEPGATLRALLDGLKTPGLAASIDPASLLQNRIDPVAATRELSDWVAHAYASDTATAGAGLSAANPRSFAVSPSDLDWAEYLGALEEINYRGFLTIWPDPSRPIGPQFAALAGRLNRF